MDGSLDGRDSREFLFRQGDRDAEVAQQNSTVVVNQKVRGLDIAVDEAVDVQIATRPSE